MRGFLMIKNNPLVTVIIPTYNRVNFISRAIDSVLNQTYSNIELIIVDDGSIDGTKDLIREKYPMAIYEYISNSGVSAARNVGIKKASGVYIAFLDSDDEWLEKKVQKQIELLNESNYRWCHGEERWIRKGARVNQKKIHQKSGGDIFNRSVHLCLVSPSTVVLEKKLLEEFNGFDESFTVCEDFDLWLRILEKYPIGFVKDEVIIKYGGHDDQLSAKFKAMDIFRIKTYQKLLEKKSLSVERKQEVLVIAQKKCEILITGYEKHGHHEKATEVKNILSGLSNY